MVRREEISKSILKNTTLEAERWVDVRSRRQGQIVAILKEEGDAVRKGTVLSRIDDAEARIDVTQNEVAFQDAQRNYARLEKLHKANLATDEQFEAAKTQLERARAQYEQAKLDLNFTVVESPISGVVTSRQIEIGNVVTNNQVVFSVADFDPLLARIRVPEKEIGKIRVGQRARITVETSETEGYRGRVKMISPVVDPESGTIKVTIEIPASAGTILRPGMFASVYIITETRENVLVIPKKALVLEGEGNEVFVFEPGEDGAGRAQRRKVEIGFTDSDRLEIVTGLADGDNVITVGQDGLRPGTEVRMVGAASQVAASAPPGSTNGDVRASGGTPLGAAAVGGDGDAERIKRMQARIFENFPEAKKIYDERVKKDPALATDFGKWRAFVQELTESGVIERRRPGS